MHASMLIVWILKEQFYRQNGGFILLFLLVNAVYLIPVNFGLGLKSSISETSLLNVLFHHSSGVLLKPEMRFRASLQAFAIQRVQWFRFTSFLLQNARSYSVSP